MTTACTGAPVPTTAGADGATTASSSRGGADLIVSEDRGVDLLAGGRGNDSCLSVADGRGDDRVRGGPGTDTFNADAGDLVTSAEVGPTACEGD